MLGSASGVISDRKLDLVCTLRKSKLNYKTTFTKIWLEKKRQFVDNVNINLI